MKEITTIQGAWSDEANGWESDVINLTGNIYLEIELSDKGRVVVKKSEQQEGPFPKALITKWGGSSFRFRIYGSTKYPYIKIITTSTPNRIEYANI